MSDQRRGVALAVTAALFSAGFLIAFQAAARGGPREGAVLAMLLWALLFNSVLTAVRWRSRPRMTRVWLATVAVLAACTVVSNLAVAAALTRMGAGLTSTVLLTQILFVILASRIFLAEPIGARFIAGAVLVLLGFALLGLPDRDAANISLIGVGYAVLAAVGFAVMLVWMRAVVSRIDPVSVNAARLVVAVAAMACLPGGVDAAVSMPMDMWLWAGAAAACGPFMSRLCLMYAVRYITASRTKLISQLSPPFAFVLAFAVYGSVPLPREAAGCALILCGVILGTLRRAELGDQGAVS